MTHGPEFQFLRSLPLFAAMEDNILADMARGLCKRKIRAGEYIFFQDDIVEHLFILEIGLVEIHKSDINGRKVTLWRIEAGNVFCLANLFAGKCFANALALADCLLFTLPRRHLVALLGQHQDLALQFITCISSKLAAYSTLLEDFAFKNVQERLIKVLLANARPGRHGNGLPACVLSQGELASRLGTCREVVSRAIAKLKNGGLIDTEPSGKSFRIVLKNPVGLKELAETG